MDLIVNIKIDHDSRKPKYKQIVDSIIDDISRGNLNVGQKIPSINEISEEFYLSRDTVEKAYNLLKERKIIESVKGKGFYVAKTDLINKVNILFLINKLSSYKMTIYNAFLNAIGTNAHLDLHIYHCDETLFLKLMERYKGHYDYYVIMSHFKNEQLQYVGYTDKVLNAIEEIPDNKLVLLDNKIDFLKEDIVQVYQDFEDDIIKALKEGLEKLKKYKKLILVYPDKSVYPYPREILHGFRKFCVTHSFDFEVLDDIYESMELRAGDTYITIKETDLVDLVKQVRESSLILGKEIGIVSYNDTPLKELLGITVIGTDFKKMGETTAQLILENRKDQIKNDFRFIDRKSM
ncbi:GntR family transcriptional regulator [Aquimarina gracilis]|uniref:GntR family transcriptional regulator n=1 Tax=Aquimarina gracilis TaxID=874422 RepID=A0ABU5ZT28_9FLAO|nr:GntR family transcriptional regulator [Aquimarina gracilis]MEB3344732.1 GntR family transcriptional regulator [Aquimarina gracilis]